MRRCLTFRELRRIESSSTERREPPAPATNSGPRDGLWGSSPGDQPRLARKALRDDPGRSSPPRIFGWQSWSSSSARAAPTRRRSPVPCWQTSPRDFSPVQPPSLKRNQAGCGTGQRRSCVLAQPAGESACASRWSSTWRGCCSGRLGTRRSWKRSRHRRSSAAPLRSPTLGAMPPMGMTSAARPIVRSTRGRRGCRH